MLKSGTTTLITFNKQMNDIMTMIDSPEELGLLIKAKQLAKQLKMKQKNKKVDFADCYYVH